MFTRPGKLTLLSIPGFVLSILPKLGCPLCWVSQLGWASSAATAYFAVSKYLAPLAAVSVGVTWILLARGANRRRHYGALLVATFACILILQGRKATRPTWETYSGVAALVGASIWIQVPRQSHRIR